MLDGLSSGNPINLDTFQKNVLKVIKSTTEEEVDFLA